MEHTAEALLVPCSDPPHELTQGLSFLAFVSRAPCS